MRLGGRSRLRGWVPHGGHSFWTKRCKVALRLVLEGREVAAGRARGGFRIEG